jgi:hypothetical protein
MPVENVAITIASIAITKLCQQPKGKTKIKISTIYMK